MIAPALHYYHIDTALASALIIKLLDLCPLMRAYVADHLLPSTDVRSHQKA